jgi:hypothetical protein
MLRYEQALNCTNGEQEVLLLNLPPIEVTAEWV